MAVGWRVQLVLDLLEVDVATVVEVIVGNLVTKTVALAADLVGDEYRG